MSESELPVDVEDVISIHVSGDLPKGNNPAWLVRVSLRVRVTRNGAEVAIPAHGATDIVAGGSRIDCAALREELSRAGLRPEPNGVDFIATGSGALDFLMGLDQLPDSWVLYVADDLVEDT